MATALGPMWYVVAAVCHCVYHVLSVVWCLVSSLMKPKLPYRQVISGHASLRIDLVVYAPMFRCLVCKLLFFEPVQLLTQDFKQSSVGSFDDTTLPLPASRCCTEPLQGHPRLKARNIRG